MLADHTDFITCLTFNLITSFLISRLPEPRIAHWVVGMASAFEILYSQPEISRHIGCFQGADVPGLQNQAKLALASWRLVGPGAERLMALHTLWRWETRYEAYISGRPFPALADNDAWPIMPNPHVTNPPYGWHSSCDQYTTE